MKDPYRVTTLTKIWRAVRRGVSRVEWAVWLLGLPREEALPTERGLIIVQIDGLSRTQLQRALEQDRMPFVGSLLEKEHYHNHVFYSGLPSSTPAVQAELYYGQRTVVPAFGFRDPRTGQLVRMYESEVASEVEQRLSARSKGLLEGGSSWCNNYGGGAAEVHFCATSFGWDEFFRTINPWKWLLVLLLNFWMFFRVLGLMVIEFFLATFDFFRGILSGRRFWQELIMIPARVVVVVLLRELVTIGAGFDTARGLPVIHVNLLGYDEQAHRRGPGSRFAHWTLRGIDRAIKRLWKAAHRGAGREYDMWIFSDHGQEATRPYELEHERLIQQAVTDIVEEYLPERPVDETPPTPVRLPTRANWLGIGWLVRMLFGEQDMDMQSRSAQVQTATSGPLGFVYLLDRTLVEHRQAIAERLVHEADVPMVVLPATDDEPVRVIVRENNYVLPQDAIQIFGSDHPFLEDVTEDLMTLAALPESGDLVLAGWTNQVQSTSFVLQNGAHAGPGIEETRGFALLPCDAPVGKLEKRYLRPDDLRLAASRFLGRDEDSREFQPLWTPPAEEIRLLTYNVHACVGMDGQLSPERIARVISQSGANIICLQELDVHRHRSGRQDQAHAIAQHLEMDFHFHPAWHVEEERFGNAILTRFPMRVVQGEGLHHYKADRSRRSALWVEIEFDEHTSLQVINAHISLYPKEQLIQSRQLWEEWVQPAALLGPVILCGDFNARPASAAYKFLAKNMLDIETFNDRPAAPPTLFSPLPISRVDHIFVTAGLHAENSRVINSRLAQIASDHLPLIADFKLDEKTPVSDDAHSTTTS